MPFVHGLKVCRSSICDPARSHGTELLDTFMHYIFFVFLCVLMQLLLHLSLASQTFGLIVVACIVVLFCLLHEIQFSLLHLAFSECLDFSMEDTHSMVLLVFDFVARRTHFSDLRTSEIS